MARLALGDICLRFTWQAWHLATSAFVLRGRCGTYGTGLALVACLGTVMPRHLCVAGVDITLHGGYSVNLCLKLHRPSTCSWSANMKQSAVRQDRVQREADNVMCTVQCIYKADVVCIGSGTAVADAKTSLVTVCA